MIRYIYILLVLLISSSGYAQITQEPMNYNNTKQLQSRAMHERLQANSSTLQCDINPTELGLDKIVMGAVRTYYTNYKIITFTLSIVGGTTPLRINNISIHGQNRADGLQLNTTWRAGEVGNTLNTIISNSNAESIVYNSNSSFILPKPQSYVVELEVNSVDATQVTQSGERTFTQTVTVSYEPQSGL